MNLPCLPSNCCPGFCVLDHAGTLTPQFVGIAPCSLYEAGDARYPGGVPGPNGVTKAGMTFRVSPTGSQAHGLPVYSLLANESGRCIGMRSYIPGRTVPMLLPCEKTDATQQWLFPTNTTRIGSILSVAAMDAGAADTALAVANSTLFGATHLQDRQPLLDVTYGEMWLQLVPYAPEPACDNRNCQDYDPLQSWYVSPRSGTMRLAAANGGGYHCDEPGCYHLTSHMPTYDEFCLARVASISVSLRTYGPANLVLCTNPSHGARWNDGLLRGDRCMYVCRRRTASTLPATRPVGPMSGQAPSRVAHSSSACSIATRAGVATPPSRRRGRWWMASAPRRPPVCGSCTLGLWWRRRPEV